jgi:long-chain acyl-CoA synthetase
LTSYKVPRVIEIRADLPRSAAGKVLRRALEEA